MRTSKKLLWILLFGLLMHDQTTIAQNFQWAFKVGGPNADIGYNIATDTSGNVYATGHFRNTVDFDPSGNIANLASLGGDDIFVAKYDANGNYLWAFNIGGTSNDKGMGIAVDPAGSGTVYVKGNFIGTVDFDPSGNTANLTGAGMYVAKYDANGNYLWAFSVDGVGAYFANGIATGPAGSGAVYITGAFSGTADFDPSGNTANLTSSGNGDMFVAKYDAGGNYLWAFNVGGTGGVVGDDIVIDTTVSGDVYVTGEFGGTADFDPSGNTANLTNGGIYVAKYDTDGNYLGAFNVEGTSSNEVWGITIDRAGSGDVYITGSFSDTADFDPSVNTANLTGLGTADAFVASYDNNGNYRWAFNLGGVSYDRGFGISTGPAGSGEVYVIGNFAGTADFDPSGNTANLTNGGMYVARYDTAGNYQWAFNVEGVGDDLGITTDSSGNIYVTGGFSGAADFDPSGNTANLTAANADIFVAKYDSPTTTIGINFFVPNEPFVIYPNPSDGKFKVEGLKFKVEKVEVFDLFGRKVLESKEPEIDMSSYPAGLYIWRVGEARGKVVIE